MSLSSFWKAILIVLALAAAGEEAIAQMAPAQLYAGLQKRERDLNVAFAERTITPERLQATTAAIGELRGQLRDTHLKYHLATAALLSPDQIRHYTELRGYTAVANAPDAPASSTSPTMPTHDAIGGVVHQHMMESMHGE